MCFPILSAHTWPQLCEFFHVFWSAYLINSITLNAETLNTGSEQARSFGRSFLHVEDPTLLASKVALGTNRLVQNMFSLKYSEFCFSVKALTDSSSMDLSISTSVSLLTRNLQSKESCADISISLGKLAKHEFLPLSQKSFDRHVFYSTDTCVLTMQVLILLLALVVFTNSWFDVHLTWFRCQN